MRCHVTTARDRAARPLPSTPQQSRRLQLTLSLLREPDMPRIVCLNERVLDVVEAFRLPAAEIDLVVGYAESQPCKSVKEIPAVHSHRFTSSPTCGRDP